jgi:hypothetical protein
MEGRSTLLRFKESFGQTYSEGVSGIKSSFKVVPSPLASFFL